MIRLMVGLVSLVGLAGWNGYIGSIYGWCQDCNNHWEAPALIAESMRLQIFLVIQAASSSALSVH
jgi:hypothetical protein